MRVERPEASGWRVAKSDPRERTFYHEVSLILGHKEGLYFGSEAWRKEKFMFGKQVFYLNY